MENKVVTIQVYVSEEEKKAFEILAKIESRSVSNLLRIMLVNKLKDRKLLKEEIDDKGEIKQTVLVGGSDE